MLPIRDINPTRRFPLITVAIIGLNVLVFIVELFYQSSGQFNRFIASYAVVPYELTQSVDVPPVSLQPAFLTIFTSMFMHGDLLHIGSNMLYLWIFGNNIEDNMGHIRFIIFYLVCGIAAAGAQVAINPTSRIPLIGASGAIAGVLGAYLVLHPRAQVETLIFLGYFIRIIRLPALVVLGFWIVLQAFQGVLSLGLSDTGGVAWFAHLGGFVAGLILVNLLRTRWEQPSWWT